MNRGVQRGLYVSGVAVAGTVASVTANRVFGSHDQVLWAWAAGAVVCAACGVLLGGRLDRVDDGIPIVPRTKPQEVPAETVPRAKEVEEIVAAVLDVGDGSRATGITVGIHGAGGFGKSTLARLVARDDRVRSHFGDRIYGVTIGRDAREDLSRPAATAGDAAQQMTGQAFTFSSVDAAKLRLTALFENSRGPVLLVLDDVWKAYQLEPFLVSSRHCVRLVTTRSEQSLPPDARRVRIGEMSIDQGLAVLRRDISGLADDLAERLVGACGRWALLLHLANRWLVRQTKTGATAEHAAGTLLDRIHAHGPTAADEREASPDELDHPAKRNALADASIKASTDLLGEKKSALFHQLGIFTSRDAIPVTLIIKLWMADTGKPEHESRQLCRELADLGLVEIESDEHDDVRVTVHEVIREHLRRKLRPEGITRASTMLIGLVETGLPSAATLDAGYVGPVTAWWELGEREGYLLDHAVEHLMAAGRVGEAEALASDLRWIQARLRQRGPTGPWSDLHHVQTPAACERAADLARIAHLLTPLEDAPSALETTLCSHLQPLPRWHGQIEAMERSPRAQPRLHNAWPPPDLPDPAVIRIVTGNDIGWGGMLALRDGTRVATVGRDAIVRIWDCTTGQLVTSWKGPDEADGWAETIMSKDARWIVTARIQGPIRVWDREGGLLISRLRTPRRLAALAISPDGDWLAIAEQAGTIRIWDRAADRNTHELTFSRNPAALAVSPDGSHLAVADRSGPLYLWDRSADRVVRGWKANPDSVSAIAISPRHDWLATRRWYDSAVQIFETDGEHPTRRLNGDAGWVTDIDISADGGWLATGDRAGVSIWDRMTGLMTGGFEHHSKVADVAVGPGNAWIAACDEASLRFWDGTARRHARRADMTGHLEAVAFGPDGSWFAAAGRTEAVLIRDCATGTTLHRFEDHSAATALAVSPDGAFVATTSANASLRIWDRTTGHAVAEFEHPEVISAGVLDPHARKSTHQGLRGILRSVAFSADGRWIAAAGSSALVLLVELGTGETRVLRPEHHGWINAVAMAPDGTWLASASDDTTAIITDLDSRSTHTIKHPAAVRTVSISPDGHWLATLTGDLEDKTARIWDVRTHAPIAHLPHPARADAMAISPDSQRLATIAEDAVLRIWNLRGHCEIALRTNASGSGSTRTYGRNALAWSTNDQIALAGARGIHLYRFVHGKSD